MPGPQVKNWPQYEALRDKGMSKAQAAAIVNARAKTKPRPLKVKKR
jgi:hypothetical protein